MLSGAPARRSRHACARGGGSGRAQARCAGGAAGGPPPGVRRGRPRKLPFRDARVWVRRNLCFEGRQDWEDYLRDGKKTPYLPDEPDVYYASQWQGWDDWLGVPLPYHEARSWAREATAGGRMPLADASHMTSAGVLTYWRREGLTPDRMPQRPHVTYRNDGFVESGGYDDFLGRELVASRAPSVSSRPRDPDGWGDGKQPPKGDTPSA